MLKQIISRLQEGNILSEKEAYDTLTALSTQSFPSNQIAAFITIYNVRCISLNELKGFRKAMLDLAIQPNINENTIDLCGTGGDGKDTFNISTLSSFLVAGAGYKVTKHGNYGVSSICGSSNMLESLGYEFTTNNDVLNKQLDMGNICFLHAPLFHPAMKNVAPVRKELGLRTFFNLLGPLSNPCRPKNQLLGVYKHDIIGLYQFLLESTATNFSIVHSTDGYDEVSLTSPFKIHSNKSNQLLTPEDLGLKTLNQSDIFGGNTIQGSKKIFLDVLQNKGTTAQEEVVIANAGIAIHTMDKSLNIESSIEKARTSLKSGNAYLSLKNIL